jgi:hypothetical protein
LRACLRASHDYEYLKVDLDGTGGGYSPTTVAPIAGVGLINASNYTGASSG